MKYGLDTEDLLLIDYLSQFFVDDRAVCIKRFGKRYWWIMYNKLITDLPIIGKTPKPFRRIFIKLEERGLLERMVENQKDLYIWLNWEAINNPQYLSEETALPNGHGYSIVFPYGNAEGQKTIKRIPKWEAEPCPNGKAIVDYYNKKIIINTHARVKELSDSERVEVFSKRLRAEVQSKTSADAFGQFFKYLYVDKINGEEITIGFVTNYQDPNNFGDYKVSLDEAKFCEIVSRYIPQIRLSLEQAIKRTNAQLRKVG